VIRLGIVGCNYGRNVLLPAFRADQRCQVVAFAGSDPARTAEVARAAAVAHAFGRWEDLVEHVEVDAVAIATPPRLQPAIAVRALARDKPVFVEKPLAVDLDSAAAMLRQAAGGPPAMIDFGFPEIPPWQKAKALIDDGMIGALRHVVVTWNVENHATRMRLRNWKTTAAEGGGALGNFVSHSLHYLEWFCGPIAGLSARLSGLPGDATLETTVALSVAFRSGVAGNLVMSSASYLGSGHRLEFYGDDGTLVLANPTTDYMRGFELSCARRPATSLARIAVDDPSEPAADGRIAAVTRLAGRFLDAIEQRQPASPGLAEGYRVQYLIDAARRSHDLGRFIECRT
jgi:predicted dehydrogenase